MMTNEDIKKLDPEDLISQFSRLSANASVASLTGEPDEIQQCVAQRDALREELLRRVKAAAAN
jgi:hypothetical protein